MASPTASAEPSGSRLDLFIAKGKHYAGAEDQREDERDDGERVGEWSARAAGRAGSWLSMRANRTRMPSCRRTRGFGPGRLVLACSAPRVARRRARRPARARRARSAGTRTSATPRRQAAPPPPRWRRAQWSRLSLRRLLRLLLRRRLSGDLKGRRLGLVLDDRWAGLIGWGAGPSQSQSRSRPSCGSGCAGRFWRTRVLGDQNSASNGHASMYIRKNTQRPN